MDRKGALDFFRNENPWLDSESSSLAASPSFFFRLNMRLNMLFGGFGGLPPVFHHQLSLIFMHQHTQGRVQWANSMCC